MTLLGFKIAWIAIGMIAAASGGWLLRDLQADAEAGAAAKAEEKAAQHMRMLSDEIATRTEAAIAGIRVENRNIYNEVQREIRTNTIYADCKLPDGGLRMLNQARASAGTGKPTDPVR